MTCVDFELVHDFIERRIPLGRRTWCLLVVMLVALQAHPIYADEFGADQACGFCVDPVIVGAGSLFNARALTFQWDDIRWTVVDVGFGVSVLTGSWGGHMGTTVQRRLLAGGEPALWLVGGLWLGSTTGVGSIIAGGSTREGLWVPLGLELSSRFAEGQAVWGGRFVTALHVYGEERQWCNGLLDWSSQCDGNEASASPLMSGLELFVGF